MYKPKAVTLNKRTITLLITFIAILIATFGAASVTTFQPDYQQEVLSVKETLTIATKKPEELSKLQSGTVTEVLDGDTIKVNISGKDYTVRYIGIDTPEIAHNSKETDQFYGQEAKSLNSWLVLNKTIFLEKDVSETDRYGRLLRYIYLNDGTMVNYLIIRLGYAKQLTYQPDVKNAELFGSGVLLAKQEKRGLFR
jgi:micrococcal nuclease